MWRGGNGEKRVTVRTKSTRGSKRHYSTEAQEATVNHMTVTCFRCEQSVKGWKKKKSKKKTGDHHLPGHSVRTPDVKTKGRNNVVQTGNAEAEPKTDKRRRKNRGDPGPQKADTSIPQPVNTAAQIDKYKKRNSGRGANMKRDGSGHASWNTQEIGQIKRVCTPRGIREGRVGRAKKNSL